MGFRLQAAAFKNVGKQGIPGGDLRLSRCPELLLCVKLWLQIVKEGNRELLFYQAATPAAALSKEIQLISSYFGFKVPTIQAHSLKRGTVSILKKLGMPLEDVNLYVGWSIHSTMFSTYKRFVVVEAVDRKFFADVV